MNDQTDPSCCEVQNERDVIKMKENPKMKISKQIVKYKLTEKELFDANGKIDTEKLRDHFNHEGRLNLATAKRIIRNAAEILRKEDTLLKVEGCYNLILRLRLGTTATVTLKSFIWIKLPKLPWYENSTSHLDTY